MGLFDSIFKGDSQTVTQKPLLTDQQGQIQDFLTQLALSGNAGGLNLGQPFQGSLGNFDLSGLEAQGINQAGQLLGSQPQGFNTALQNLSKIANSGTDINADLFQSFRNQLNRSTQDADNVLNRESAITGSRFGTGIQGRKQDLAAQQSDILGTKLLELFNQAQNRSVGASQALGSLGLAQDDNQRANIFNALQAGAVQRNLKNQEAQANLNEFLRQRDEELSRVGIGQNVFNRNVDFGVKSQTVSSPSPFSSLINTALTGAATAFGGPIGGALANKALNIFNPQTPKVSLGSPKVPQFQRVNAQDFFKPLGG